jgi:hypothetical protein
MEKISYEDLKELFNCIDYCFKCTYPLVFYINGLKYQAGIGDYNCDISELDDDCYDEYCKHRINECYKRFEYINEDLCYLGNFRYEDINLIYLDDSDAVCNDTLDKIFKRHGIIKKKAELKNIEIYLDTDNSFNGIRRTLFWDEVDDKMFKEIVKTNKYIQSELKKDDFFLA